MAELGYGIDSETDVATRRRENDLKKKKDRDDMPPPPPMRKIRYDSTPSAIDEILKAAVTKENARSSEDYYTDVPESQKAIVGTYRRNNYTNKIERVTCGTTSDPDILERVGRMTESQYIAYLRSRQEESSAPAHKPSMTSMPMTVGIQQCNMYTVMTRNPDTNDEQASAAPSSVEQPLSSYDILRDDQRQRGPGREKTISTDPRVLSMRSQRLQQRLNRVNNIPLAELVSTRKKKKRQDDSSDSDRSIKRPRT